MGITFLGADMDHWCHAPQLANLSEDQQRYISIPYDTAEQQKYSQCYMYDLNYRADVLRFSGYNTEDFIHWNRSTEIATKTPTKKCTSWQYDQSVFISSYVSAMDLVCDRASLVSVIQTIYMTGFLSGCIGFGQLSDRIGRRKTLIISLVCQVVFATAGIFATNYVLCVIFRFLVGATASGAFTTIFVFSMEIIGEKFRDATGIMVQAWFAVGLMILPGAAYFIRDHVHLQWLMAMTPVIMILYSFFIPESARWLVSQGRDDEATEILEKAARFNKKTLPNPLDLHENRQWTKIEDKTTNPSLLNLLKTPNLRKITIVMWSAWFVTSMVYYGLSLGVNLIGGNIFLNSFLSGGIEIPCYILVIPIMNKLGRRWTTVGSLIAAGISCFICTGIFNKSDAVSGFRKAGMWSLAIYVFQDPDFATATLTNVITEAAQ
ncbi:Organic cation transporter protein [Lamellibrachia satsuma]|nr:Organic cation transporter protein [Lamellibrachia satsuma]